MFYSSRIDDFRVWYSVRHRGGPRNPRSRKGAPGVVCLVQNGEPYIDSFVSHYRSIGCGDILFLDNDSSDKTVERALQHNNVSVFSCSLPFRSYQLGMKRWLLRTMSKRDWCVSVDIDEYLEYPAMSVMPLSGFLLYLDSLGANAVTALMLDCFHNSPLSTFTANPESDPHDLYPYCETESIRVSRSGISITFSGGIRERIFGTKDICLTKHPLLKPDGKLKAYCTDEHFVQYAVLPDVSCILLHYKFVPDFPERVAYAVEQENHFNASWANKCYASILALHPHVVLTSPSSFLYRGVEDKTMQEFVRISDTFRNYERRYCSNRSGMHTGQTS